MSFPATPGGRIFVVGRASVALMALIALMAPMAAGCRSHEPVRIGVVVTDEAIVAARLAATRINATGGIHGHLLELRVVTGGSSTRASPALAAADELSRDPTVFGIVGHSNSSASLSAAQIYNARHVVQIAPSSSAPLLSKVGPYTFRLAPSDIHQARFLAEEVVSEHGTPRTAMFFVNDDYGHALHEEFRARLDRAGVPVVYDAPYNHEDPLPDPAATALRVAETNPELLVWLGRSAQLRQLLPELRQKSPKLPVLASDGIDEAITDRNPGGLLNGVLYVRLVDTHAARASLEDLRQRFLPAAGLPLTAEAALTYDGVMLLATAARAAGTDREAVRAYLADVGTRRPPYEGVTGTIAFGENGDPRPSYCSRRDHCGRAADRRPDPTRGDPLSRGRSLRRLLLLGTLAFALAASSVMVVTLVLFGSVRRDVERDAKLGLSEQHAADEIATSVYGQILAAYQQLEAPSARNMERFDALGRKAYTRLREYLFQEMPFEARLEVESIKEQHQALEVVAHGAFDLIARGDSEAASARIAEMHRLAELLQASMARFVVLRESDLQLEREAQSARIERLLVGLTVVGAGLIGLAVLFVRLMKRSVVAPLGQLAAAAVSLGSGDLDARISNQRHSELQTVARRFNEMADSLQEGRARIEKQNLELSGNLQRLEKAQQDLVQQEKMGAIGFMLAGLAHELNNPLAAILGNAECIAQELGSHSDPAILRVRRELVAPLIQETGRAGDLVRNLLHFSRQSSSQIGSVHLRFAVEVAAGLRAYAFTRANKVLTVDISDELFVVGDAQRLEHAIMNIMTNALEAISAESGTRLDGPRRGGRRRLGGRHFRG